MGQRRRTQETNRGETRREEIRGELRRKRGATGDSATKERQRRETETYKIARIGRNRWRDTEELLTRQ